MIGQRLLRQAIQFARRGVTLDLKIPLGPILFHQPLTELRKLVRIEFGDLLFQLFDAGHGLFEEQVYDDLSSERLSGRENRRPDPIRQPLQS